MYIYSVLLLLHNFRIQSFTQLFTHIHVLTLLGELHCIALGVSWPDYSMYKKIHSRCDLPLVVVTAVPPSPACYLLQVSRGQLAELVPIILTQVIQDNATNVAEIRDTEYRHG